MYIPASFVETDPAILAEVMEAHSFATLVTVADGEPFATHPPLLLDRGRSVLRGHLARANPHWRHFGGESEALAIFLGPHAYISPTWYANRPAVPTWNYVAVHAYGTVEVLHDEATAELLDDLVHVYEADQAAPWDGVLPDDLARRLRAAVVGFELSITRLEGKLKLSQNRGEGDIAGAVAALSASPNPRDRALAAWMARV